MAESFIPFAAENCVGKSGEAFRLRVLPNGEAGSVPFRPMGTSNDCQIDSSQQVGQAPDAGVSLVREGERITLIRFRCSCGELVELECVY